MTESVVSANVPKHLQQSATGRMGVKDIDTMLGMDEWVNQSLNFNTGEFVSKQQVKVLFCYSNFDHDHNFTTIL